jgi:phosphatidylserine decarboxylase
MRDFVPLGVLFALATALPLSLKWCLGVRRTAVVVVALAVLFGFLLALVGVGAARSTVERAALVWLLTIGAAFAILACWFYRDPERTPPAREDVIISPADGEVIYVRGVRGGVLPVSSKQGRHHQLRELTRTPLHTADAIVVGIGMSLLDVHVNRAAIGGCVSLQRRFPGGFASLRLPEAVFTNERMTTLIERGDLQVAIIQIASRLVRRITSYVRENQGIAAGQRIGMIRFGSQVDLVLPARKDLEVVVRCGDRVTAGESIVAVLRPPTRCGASDAS